MFPDDVGFYTLFSNQIACSIYILEVVGLISVHHYQNCLHPITDGEESKVESTMTCDGHYLYLHNAHGLYKVGSGFGGTIKGHVYIHRPDFYPRQRGWLGFAHVSTIHCPSAWIDCSLLGE